MRRTRWTAFGLAVMTALTITLGGCSGNKENVDSESTANSTNNVAGDSASNSSADSEDNTTDEKTSVTVGIAQDLDSLDPHLATGAGTKEVLFNIFEGLVKPDSNGDLYPAVASDYTVAEDGSSIEFTLREGVKFHNGEEVTAEDVKYSLERCAGMYEADGTALVTGFSNLDSVEIQEDGTVLINLKTPDTEFITYMTVAIIPADYDAQTTAPIGTGPFAFVSRNEGDKVVLKKFDEYWGTPAYLDEVVFKVCSDSDAVVTNLNGGSIDIYPNLTASMAASLNDNFEVLEGTMNLVQALYLNNAVEPFDNEKVRQALCYAVDAQEIMDLTSDGKGTAVGSSMFPAFGKYFMPELSEAYPKNVEKAKELLAEAGYPDGFDMTITVPSNYEPHIETAQVIVEELKAINVNASIQLIEWDAWLADVYSERNYESTVIGLDASTLSASALLARFVSDSSKNFTNFSDEAYDIAFANAKAAVEDDEKTAYYKECLQILSDRAANVYIQDMADFVAIRSDLKGYTFYPLYVIDMSLVYIEE
ncbi:MAG: ABC transporter substrate-binding protein [Lachnospiraceae bacterium]